MDEKENKASVAVDYMNPANLVRYAFYWTMAQMAITVLALLMGGYPPVFYILGYGSLVTLGLKLAWIMSGAAAAYLLYRCYKNKHKIFTKETPYDKPAFLFAIITGLNLGVVGLLNKNIAMMITSSGVIYNLVAVAYVVAIIYLWRRWSALHH